MHKKSLFFRAFLRDGGAEGPKNGLFERIRAKSPFDGAPDALFRAGTGAADCGVRFRGRVESPSRSFGRDGWRRCACGAIRARRPAWCGGAAALDVCFPRVCPESPSGASASNARLRPARGAARARGPTRRARAEDFDVCFRECAWSHPELGRDARPRSAGGASPRVGRYGAAALAFVSASAPGEPHPRGDRCNRFRPPCRPLWRESARAPCRLSGYRPPLRRGRPRTCFSAPGSAPYRERRADAVRPERPRRPSGRARRLWSRRLHPHPPSEAG